MKTIVSAMLLMLGVGVAVAPARPGETPTLMRKRADWKGIQRTTLVGVNKETVIAFGTEHYAITALFRNGTSVYECYAKVKGEGDFQELLAALVAEDKPWKETSPKHWSNGAWFAVEQDGKLHVFTEKYLDSDLLQAVRKKEAGTEQFLDPQPEGAARKPADGL